MNLSEKEKRWLPFWGHDGETSNAQGLLVKPLPPIYARANV